MGVSGRGLDSEHALGNRQEGHVESATTEIEDEDSALLLVRNVKTVRECGGRGLVDDAENLESGDGSGILGGLALRVVEVGGDSDDGLLDRLAEVGLRRLLHLGEDHRRDLLGCAVLLLALVVDADERLAAVLLDDLERPHLHVMLHRGLVDAATNETLGIEYRVLGIHGSLVLSGISDQTLRVRKGNIRGRSAVALVVGDDLDAVILPDTDARVGRAEIDADGSRVLLRLRHFLYWYIVKIVSVVESHPMYSALI
eukprot:Opistho-2@24879